MDKEKKFWLMAQHMKDLLNKELNQVMVKYNFQMNLIMKVNSKIISFEEKAYCILKIRIK